VSALLAGAPRPGEAQPAGALHRIGVLDSAAEAANEANLDAFREGLRALGRIEGQHYVIEYRSADGRTERLPDLARELVRLQVDVIVTRGTSAALGARHVTTTIPIVMASSGDPVFAGLVTSLARPGGNVTGLHLGVRPALAGERLRLEQAFETAVLDGVDALIVVEGPLTVADLTRFVDFAAMSRLPAMYGLREFVDAGGLMAYGPDPRDLSRRAASDVHRILDGARPADLPVEPAAQTALMINLKTAERLGLTIPPPLLRRADYLIP
jgi:putative ABC transport system substrate-binding protein